MTRKAEKKGRPRAEGRYDAPDERGVLRGHDPVAERHAGDQGPVTASNPATGANMNPSIVSPSPTRSATLAVSPRIVCSDITGNNTLKIGIPKKACGR